MKTLKDKAFKAECQCDKEVTTITLKCVCNDCGMVHDEIGNINPILYIKLSDAEEHLKKQSKSLTEDVEILGSRISLYEEERKRMEDKYLTAIKVINKLRDENEMLRISLQHIGSTL